MAEHFDSNGWSIEFDLNSTRAAYALSDGGAHVCQCGHCRNFRTVRDAHCPAAFLELLKTFGIDAHKEAEIFEYGPGKHDGTRFYVGWYHFIGTLIRDPGTEIRFPSTSDRVGDWLVGFREDSFLALKPLEESGQSLVQLEFQTELPWVLQEEP